MIKKNIKIILSFLFTIIILFFLLKEIDVHNVIYISKFNILALATSLILYLLIKIINTLRYSNVYKIQPSFILFFLLCSSNFMLSIIPFRLGELSYVSGMKKHFKVPCLQVVNNIILIRLVDYILISLIFLISSIYVSTNISHESVKFISFFLILSLIISLLLFYFFVIKDIKLEFTRNIFNKIFTTFKIGIQYISNVSKRTVFFLFFYSFIYWGLRLFMSYILLFLFGIKLPVFLVVFVSLLLLLFGLLPTQTFANFGFFEGGWVYFLVLLGFKYDETVSLLLQYHIILLLPVIIYGLIGIIFLKFIHNSQN